jgi:hypothetical protein
MLPDQEKRLETMGLILMRWDRLWVSSHPIRSLSALKLSEDSATNFAKRRGHAQTTSPSMLRHFPPNLRKLFSHSSLSVLC